MAENTILRDILNDPRYNDANEPGNRADAIEKQIKVLGWEPVRTLMIDILKSKELQKYRDDALAVLWGAVLDSRPMNTNLVVALLCRCRQDQPPHDDNLIWSIIAKLKRVEYLSKYDPLQDPDVREELDRLGP